MGMPAKPQPSTPSSVAVGTVGANPLAAPLYGVPQYTLAPPQYAAPPQMVAQAAVAAPPMQAPMVMQQALYSSDPTPPPPMASPKFRQGPTLVMSGAPMAGPSHMAPPPMTSPKLPRTMMPAA